MAFQPTDIALFLISFAACIYCMVLSRRLARLQNTKDGLGATITACTDSISSMSLATRGTTAQAKELASELSALLQRAEQVCEKIELRTRKMEVKHEQLAAKGQKAQTELDIMMRNVLAQHKKQIAELLELTKRARILPDQTTSTVDGTHQNRFQELVETNIQKRAAS